MGGRIKSIESHERQVLTSGWCVRALPAGSVSGPQQLGADLPTEWIAAVSLGSAAAVLRAANAWSLDDSAVRRFDAEDWWFRTSFDALKVDPGDRLFLGFDGLATVAEAWLNGELLLNSRNMFVSHEFDVTELLKAQGNELCICHRSLDRALLLRRPRPRWRAPMIEHQQLRWFRTTVLGRTPGWSPPAAVVGPWRDVWLERRRQLSIEDLQLRASVVGCSGRLDVSCTARSRIGQVSSVTVALTRGGFTHTSTLKSKAGGEAFEGLLLVDGADLWWPHTHGEPALYDAELNVYISNGDSIQVTLGAVGFRTIEIDRSSDSFSLTINGLPIFCRGACWTPLDAVSLRSTREAYETALKSVRRAGMNMLRVCGTMVYEDDGFLESCDRNGVLLWQDMMFANMDFPQADGEFMSSIETEARQQLQRLQAHACLAVICGNSEVEQQAAMWGTARDAWASDLFESVMRDWVERFCPGATYWPSSAHGGSIPHQVDAGTTSYFGVGAYLRPLDDARRSGLRFATESLAFANVPGDTTIARMPGGSAIRVHHAIWKARSPRDLGAGWDFDDVRDHYFAKLFGIDPLSVRYSNHERYLKMSRMLTGEIMSATLLEWRRNNSTCRGALVLFLRDLWAGAGWGLLDDEGMPKPCYHYVKRACQPIAMALSDEGNNGLHLHLWNDPGEAIQGLLDISIYRVDGVRLSQAVSSLTLEPHAALNIVAAAEFETAIDIADSFRFSDSEHSSVIATLRDIEGALLAQAFHFQDGLRLTMHHDLGMTAVAQRLADGSFDLDLQTTRLAQSVHFEVAGFLADDEYFHMAPGSKRRVKLCPLAGMGPSRPTGQAFAVNCKQSVNIQWIV